MIAAILTRFVGPKVAGWLAQPVEWCALAGIILLGVHSFLAGYKQSVLNGVKAQQAQAALDYQQHTQAVTNGAVDQVAAETVSRVAQLLATERAVHAAPVSQACVNSPAARAYLGELRANLGASGGQAATDPHVAADVPRAAGTAPVHH